MEEEKAVTQAPKSDEEKETKVEPAADTKENNVESTDAAAPSKEAKSTSEAVDDKKSEENSEPTEAAKEPKKEEEAVVAEKPKVEEEAESPSEAVDEKKSEETSEPMDVAEEPKEDKAESPSEASDEKKSEETSEPMDDAEDEEPKKDEAESPSEDGAGDDTKKASEPILTGRGRRERKPTKIYQPVEEKTKKEKVIPDGKGEKLEDMPNVVANFKAITLSDPDLLTLYSIVFGIGKKKEFKGHLLQFNGLVYPEGKEEAEKDRMKSKMYKLKMEDLKAVMDLADIDRSAQSFAKEKEIVGKEVLCNRFLEWLEEPKASGKKLKETPKKGKRKSEGGSAKKATPAKKAKKTTPAKAKKATPAKKATSAKKATPAKKTSAKKAAAKPSPASAKAPEAIDFNIPGVDIEKVRAKVKSIVENADRAELTVKGVRKMLEDWLDTDLTDHKDAVRSIVMEVM
eukprot:CAMPEP_0201992906 /NCGR_PEP_ID=MMETSP0905-20130828/1300_1 /ASSEMBLY_ACC=CAM_ASM_000554 /TAXON_ID=420261 /ORGANISM="Thalassiosira antarctica, Strain CCMP982" /LENGTH=456 /DNA_ID=CAMNT_0048547659 /DNA_START=102 /DNA_END=1472 /DNA_ORIENTATION=+